MPDPEIDAMINSLASQSDQSVDSDSGTEGMYDDVEIETTPDPDLDMTPEKGDPSDALQREEEKEQETPEEEPEPEADDEEGEEVPVAEEEEYEDGEEEEQEELRPTKSSEIEQMKAQMAALQDMNAQLLRSIQSQQAPVESPETQTPQYQPLNFVASDEEFDAALSNPDSLNRLLSRVYYAAQQESARNMTGIVQQTLEEHVTLKGTVDDFLAKNPDLRARRDYLGPIANRVASEHPELPLEGVLERTAEVARKVFNLRQPTIKTKKNRKRPPNAKVKPTGARPSGDVGRDKRSELERELDALM